MTFFEQQIIENRPIMIDPAVLAEYCKRLPRAGMEWMDEYLGPVPAPETHGNIAVIPVVGVIGMNLCPLEKRFGGCDLADIRDWIAAAQDDPAIRKIILHIDSPGGCSIGVSETGDMVRESEKTIIAYTSMQACSAAYWLGSQAKRFLASASSAVGSVGVYIGTYDYAKMFEGMGIAPEVIKGGTQKAAFFPGTTLSDEQRAHLQSVVDEMHLDFQNAVKSVRTRVRTEDMQGQWFPGSDAARRGMVTGICPSLADLIRQLS